MNKEEKDKKDSLNPQDKTLSVSAGIKNSKESKETNKVPSGNNNLITSKATVRTIDLEKISKKLNDFFIKVQEIILTEESKYNLLESSFDDNIFDTKIDKILSEIRKLKEIDNYLKDIKGANDSFLIELKKEKQSMRNDFDNVMKRVINKFDINKSNNIIKEMSNSKSFKSFKKQKKNNKINLANINNKNTYFPPIKTLYENEMIGKNKMSLLNLIKSDKTNKEKAFSHENIKRNKYIKKLKIINKIK